LRQRINACKLETLDRKSVEHKKLFIKNLIKGNSRAKKFDVRTLIIDDIVPGADSVVGMVITKEGIIYGGLTNPSGSGHLLLKYDPYTDTVRDCGVILIDDVTPKDQPDKNNVKLGHHALEIGCDGKIYGCTSALHGPSYALYSYEVIDGGHMISYDPKTREIKDFGVPVPHEFGFAATIDPKGEKFYCFTYPMNFLFIFEIPDGIISVKGQIRGSLGEFICHDLVRDKLGNVYGSYGAGALFKYDPDKDKIIETDIKLPGKGVLDAGALADDGTIYGGTRDGHFFSFDPETEKIRNLGSPPGGKRTCGVEVARGKIYGFQGDVHTGGIGNTHLFVYDPDTDKVTDLGLVEDSTRGTWAGTRKRAYVIHSTAIGLDGTIYAGETDRYPHLYIIKLRE